MLLGAHLIDPRANRDLGCQIEPIPRQFHQLAEQILLGQRHHCRVAAPPHPGLGRQHLLERHTVHVGKYGAQRLVAGDDVIDGRRQRLDVQRPADPKRGRHVVGRHPALEPVEEPQPALRIRQRHHRRPRAGHQRLTRTAVPADTGRQLGNGGRLEHGAHREAGVQGFVDGGDDPHR